MSADAPPLLLFDIDGTLMRKSGPHHREALVDAVRAVTGLATSNEQIPVQGMLDRDIIAWMLRDAGESASRIQTAMPAIVEKAQRLYTRRCPDLRSKVCPGVRMALHRMTRRSIRKGLVTGNLSRIGWAKVDRAGIGHHFVYGAFAEQGRDRASLVKLAIARALENGWITRHSTVALFGDHENDILAAKANRIRSVAVATGMSSAAQLAALAPDFLLEDMRALPLDRILA